MKCGDLALYSHRIIEDDQLILLGEKITYEPLCRKCYLEEKKNK
jgi:thymidine kinase